MTAVEQCAWWCERLIDPCFVYVVQAQPGTPVKIGVARNVPARMATLQTGNPYRLRLLYVLPGEYELEWQLHQKLERVRLPGGEWFDASSADRALLSALSEAMMTAYAGDGRRPSYRQPGFSWARRVGRVTVRHVEPEPVPPDEAAARLRAAWMRPRKRGDWSGYSADPGTGSIV